MSSQIMVILEVLKLRKYLNNIKGNVMQSNVSFGMIDIMTVKELNYIELLLIYLSHQAPKKKIPLLYIKMVITPITTILT